MVRAQEIQVIYTSSFNVSTLNISSQTINTNTITANTITTRTIVSDSNNTVVIGSGVGATAVNQNSVGIGFNAVPNIPVNSVVIGAYAGGNSAGINQGVAIGNYAAFSGGGSNTVAVGYAAGSNNQFTRSVAIGSLAGNSSQFSESVSVLS